MKKVLFTLFIVAIAVSSLLVVGCQKQEQPAGQQQQETQAAGPDFKIGIVFDVGGRGDKSFNDSAYRGLIKIAEEYNGYIKDDPDNVNHGTKVEMKYLEPKQGGQDREQLLRVLAEDGYHLLYGVGFAFTDALGRVSKDFPDTHFALIDGYIPDLTADSNVTCIAFKEHEGSFMVGALAGMWLADHASGQKLGFIGGMDIPLIHKFHGGFLAGAMYANPNLRPDGMIMGQYIGQDPTAFNDPQKAEQIATNMYDQGAEIIYHAAGASGSGLFKAAYEADKWAIGVDSDQGLVYASSDSAEERAIGEHIMTSMLKRVDNGVFLLAKDYIDNSGNVDGGYVNYGLAENGVGVAVNQYNQDLIAPYQDKLNQYKQEIIDGKISVPDSDTKIADWKKATF